MKARSGSVARSLAIALGMVTGCGPRVVDPHAGGSAESGDEAGGDGTDDPYGGEVSTSAGSPGESSGGSPGVCGDGVLDPTEACDDGNDVDADGCSHLCEPSGSVSWSVDLTPSRGFATGLDARDGEAYVLVEDYHEDVGDDFEAITSRVSVQGMLVGQYHHLGALADLDLAREAIASMPGGEVIVGYPASEGALARLDLDEGLVWVDPIAGWSYSAATRWFAGEVWTLRYTPGPEPFLRGLFHFTDEGDALDVAVLGDEVQGTMPLRAGPLFPRGGGRALAFTWAADRPLQMHAVHSGQSTVEEVGASGVEPRAFAHGLEIAVWLENERVMIDALDHIQPPQPRPVPGFVLTSFVGGFVIQNEQTIGIYDDAGTLRWSHVALAVPRFAAPDGLGGMFVLSDHGIDETFVVLERLVL